MKQINLQQYTMDVKHYGCNQRQVLSRFLLYSKSCSDPLNVYRYMEEKVICTFLPAFWLHKAHYLAECGHYRNSFECLQEARSRNGIDDNNQSSQSDSMELQIDYQRQEYNLCLKLEEDMKRFPLKSKRSIDQFNTMDETTNLEQKKQKLLEIYEKKYAGLLREKQRDQYQKRQKLPKSWLYQKYQYQNDIQLKIEQRIHENSVKLSREVRHHSMHTPIKVRDPQRLTKAMDSVQILKRKRSTREKSRKHKLITKDQQDQQEIEQNQMVNSLPVGNQFFKLRRRVTFQLKTDIKIHKIKSEDIIQTQTNSIADLGFNPKTPKLRQDHFNKNSSVHEQKSVSFNTTPLPQK